MRGTVFYILLLFIGLLPLLWLTPKHYHDWGDDFAAYLYQAENIAQGKLQKDNFYIFNNDTAEMGPKTYPVGYPLFLSVFMRLGFHSISFFQCINALLLILFCISIYCLLRLHFSSIASFIVAIFIGYLPSIVFQKWEIGSDFLFAVIYGWSLFYFVKKSHTEHIKHFAFWGILSAMLFNIRQIGIAFPLFILFFFIVNFRHFSFRFLLKNSLVFIASLLLSHICMHFILAKGYDNSGNLFAKNLIANLSLFDIIPNNITYYSQEFQRLFHSELVRYNFFTIAIYSFCFTFLIIGFLHHLFSNRNMLFYAFIAYCIPVLLFPHGFQHIRYFIPAIPFFCYLTMKGLLLLPFFRHKHSYYSYIIALVLYVLNFNYMYQAMYEHDYSSALNNVLRKENVELFDFVKSECTTGAISFAKPRAIAYFAHKPAVFISDKVNPYDYEKELQKHGVRYIVVNKYFELKNQALFIEIFKEKLDLRFENNLNKIYMYQH